MVYPRIEFVATNGTRAETHRDNIATVLENKNTMFGDSSRTTIVTKVGDNIESLEEYEIIKKRIRDAYV